VELDVKPTNAPPQTWRCPWLLAADGAHSTVRGELGIPFDGSSFATPWHLVDIPLATRLPDDFAHVFFLDGGGFLFLIRVIDEPEKSGRSDPVWRVMGDVPDPLARLDAGRATGAAVWASEFHISHRINDRLQQGQVYFAGDAAHIHSPIGARGMNLGIEDAWTFSQLLKEGELWRYDALRHRVDQRVVRRIEQLSRLARGESLGSRLLRSTAVPVMTRMPLTRNRLMTMVTGLDHPLKAVANSRVSYAGEPS
jgi:2-polyprenyl-6-methoxyphenol hydroxylase-like FAD-dependent oxidoreductase